MGRKVITITETDDSGSESDCDQEETGIEVIQPTKASVNPKPLFEEFNSAANKQAVKPKMDSPKTRKPKPAPEENTEYASKRSMRSGITSMASKSDESVTTCSVNKPSLSSYEFLKSWTSHKQSKNIDPFVSLLTQVEPSTISQGLYLIICLAYVDIIMKRCN